MGFVISLNADRPGKMVYLGLGEASDGSRFSLYADPDYDRVAMIALDANRGLDGDGKCVAQELAVPVIDPSRRQQIIFKENKRLGAILWIDPESGVTQIIAKKINGRYVATCNVLNANPRAEYVRHIDLFHKIPALG